MKNYRVLLTVMVLLALVNLAGLRKSGQVIAQNQNQPDPVHIVSPLPLPVTGNTTVSGSVAATQSGNWNVGISGNSATNPLFTRDVDNPARQPVQIELCTFDGAFSCGSIFSSYQVSSTRRLVVEYVSGECLRDPTTKISLLPSLSTSVANVLGDHKFFAEQAAVESPTTARHVIHQETRIYADPGTFVNLNPGGVGFESICAVTLSGYTITP